MANTHIAVIQARMGSTRFPGKIVADIAGQPLLWHIIYRLKKSRYITEIVIASSDDIQNDCLSQFVGDNIHLIRGDEHNVLSRFEKVAARFNPKTITRVCGDSPFIDASFIDRAIDIIQNDKVDYVVADSTNCIHEGIDCISMECFEKILAYSDHPVAMEHVTGIIHKFPDQFIKGFIPLVDFEKKAGIRLSIDTKSDLNFVSKLYKVSNKSPGELKLESVVEIIEKNPDLLDINRHVLQKSMDQQTELIVLDVNQDSIDTLLKYASEVSEKYGYGICLFVLKSNANEWMRLKMTAFGVIDEDTYAGLNKFIKNNNIKYVVYKNDDFYEYFSNNSDYKLKKGDEFIQLDL